MKNTTDDKDVNQIVKSEHMQMVKGSGGLQLNTIQDMLAFAEYVASSPFCPTGMKKPGDILVCLQAGAEIGLSPMTSLQSIAVINGRPGIFGDAALALVRASGLLEAFKEEMIGAKDTGDDYGCQVTLKRFGYDQHIEIFTIADAKRAKLWGKAGPWTQYPKRMLKFRSRGFALRDMFGDVLKGFKIIEELKDYPAEPENVTPGKLIKSITDEHAHNSPNAGSKTECPAENTEVVVDESEKVEAATDKRHNWNKIIHLCEEAKILYPNIEAWAKAEGRNIDMNTEEGCQKILDSWEQIKELLTVKL